MSLFSRLKEQARARDSQDDSKAKDKTSDSQDEGGLFGAVQLSPAQSEASVPPPPRSESPHGAGDAGDTSQTIIAPSEMAPREISRLQTTSRETTSRDASPRESVARETVIAPTETTHKTAPETSTRERVMREVSTRGVPSLEEARAELDRARAQRAAQNPTPGASPGASPSIPPGASPGVSGLFRRDRNADDEADDTARAPGAAPRQTVSFGEVSLPLRTPDDTPPGEVTTSPDALAIGRSGVTSEDIFEDPRASVRSDVTGEDIFEKPSGEPEEKPFRVPSLAQFGDRETARETVIAPTETPVATDSSATARSVVQGDEQSAGETVYAPTLPDARQGGAASPGASEAPNERQAATDETVYAPTPQSTPDRQVMSRTESQTVPASELADTINAMRSAQAPRETTDDAPTDEAPIEARAETRPSAMPPRASDPIAAPDAPAPPPIRSASNASLTPFQRLMAARAAQSGPPISRPRAERPAPVAPAPVEAPPVEAPPAEIASVEAEASFASASDGAGDDERFAATPARAHDEPSLPATPQTNINPLASVPSAEVSAPEAPAIVAPEGQSAPLVPAPATMPDVEAPAPIVALTAPEAAIEVPDLEVPAVAPEPEVAAPALQAPPLPARETPVAEALPRFVEPTETLVVENQGETEVESPETLATQTAAFGAAQSARAAESALLETEMQKARDAVSAALEAPETGASQNIETPQLAEAETVPEEPQEMEANSMEVEDAEVNEADSHSMIAHPPASGENENAQARPALSLAERLARAPRAELDAAHAEAQALTPEVLDEAPSMRDNFARDDESNAPRRTAPMSFAERLAARNRANETPAAQPAPAAPAAPAVPSEAPARAESAPENATPQSFAPQNVTPPVPPSQPSASDEDEEPRRSGPRSFSERLAARTGLDRHLQVPAEEAAPASQELAQTNTELARIDEGAELSEREMKNRVLFRQKHLIFDPVIGALDPRVLQNPTRDAIKPHIERAVDAALREFELDLEGFERNWMVDEFVRETTDLGALVPLLEDPSVSKIVVTGARDVSVERLGRIERTGLSFRDDDHLLSLVRRIAEMSGGRVDAKVPLLDRPLPDGGRIRAKVPPLAPQPTLTIEKSTGNPFVALKRQMDEKTRGDSLPYAQLRERIQQKLLREFEGNAASLQGDQDKLRQQVEEMIGGVIAEEGVVVSRAERASLVMDLLNEIVGLGPIEPLLNDPDVDEVMVNGPYQIYVERKGKLELTSQRFRDNGHVMQVIDRIVAPLGRRVDEKSPMVDGRLRDGSRFNAVIPPLALSGPTMTIRKFARDPFTMSDLINFGSLTREAAQFLQAAVEGRLNVVVSGGTGSGKTTTLNVLSSFIPSSERIVTIEDAAELQMRQEHVIRMETRPPNIEGVGEIGIRDLVRNALRMRPDRIVVGECRGGEALDMLQAMNTGHDGSLTTAHSNGPRDTCKRLETMVMMAGFDLPVRAIREQISMAVQLVVHQERMRDGKRRVTAITEIVGMEGDVLTLQDIFRFEQEGIDDDGRIIGQLQATGMRPKYYETIIDNGVALSMDIFQPKAHEAAPRARMQERGGR